MSTCMPSSRNFSYMFLNLVGEVGEFAGKVAKAIRKEKATIDFNQLVTECGNKSMTDEEMLLLRKEVGDIMWETAGLCYVMGWDLEDVCQENLDKLSVRKANNTIDGSGDGVTAEERKD